MEIQKLLLLQAAIGIDKQTCNKSRLSFQFADVLRQLQKSIQVHFWLIKETGQLVFNPPVTLALLKRHQISERVLHKSPPVRLQELAKADPIRNLCAGYCVSLFGQVHSEITVKSVANESTQLTNTHTKHMYATSVNKHTHTHTHTHKQSLARMRFVQVGCNDPLQQLAAVGQELLLRERQRHGRRPPTESTPALAGPPHRSRSSVTETQPPPATCRNKRTYARKILFFLFCAPAEGVSLVFPGSLVLRKINLNTRPSFKQDTFFFHLKRKRTYQCQT